ncbi:hypothetical protein [Lactococcus lactis]|uniref:hypothetical protein n=1 Tax=Lactococcus lactis TaxID=1358 RepID=UPI00315D9904
MKDSTVFLSGSLSGKEIPQIVNEWVDRYILNKCNFILGDAKGIDSLFQNYLIQKEYNRVKIFGVKKIARNKADENWKYVKVDVPMQFRKTDRMLFLFRDFYLSKQADGGIVIWEPQRKVRGHQSVSKGSLFNMINLLSEEKNVVLYYLPNEEIQIIRSLDELFSLYIRGNLILEKAWNELFKMRKQIIEYETGPSDDIPEEKDKSKEIRLF